MRTIRVSEGVWNVIAEKGKFGETEDDVLRRIFGLPPGQINEGNNVPFVSAGRRLPRRPIATNRMSSYIDRDTLYITFLDGTSQSWTMPDRSDKLGIRAIREEAIAFAKENDATAGQINAVKKTLTDAGYHLIK